MDTEAQKFIGKYSDIHPFPHIVTTISRLIADSDSTIKDFEDVIKMDPILVSRLLRLVNSPFYGLAHAVDSIGRAVAYLGMKNLHNLIVADALKGIFNAKETKTTFSKNRLWLHSAAVSLCSKMVAERIFGINGDDAFLCGILHDFGLLVEEQVEQQAFENICTTCKSTADLIAMERQAFATDHCEIGYAMTLGWNMPVTIQVAIRDHHLLSDAILPPSLTGIVQIAEYLVGQLNHTTLPNVTSQISPSLLEYLQNNLDEFNVLIEDLPEEMAKAQAIYS